jgi:flavorubredoxin
MDSGAMRVLVLYETHHGYTLTVARAIRDDIRARGLDATTAAIRTVDAGTVAAADALVVGSWTAGKIVIGVGPPAEARDAIERLPRLDGRPAAVFCTYGVAPRGTLTTLASRLIGRGATVEVGGAFRNGLLARTGRTSLRKVPTFVDEALASFDRAASPTRG